jgi:membrane protein YqaA with SNARE-associated domain
MEGRPVYAGAVMFVAASVGIPPLLVMAAVAGMLKMPMWVFLPTVFVGRSIRFGLLFLGVDAFLPEFLHF